MSLNEEIQQLLASFNAPEDVAAAIAKGYAEAGSPEAAPGIEVGEKAPEFSLKDSAGREVSLAETLRNGPAVVSFFRGAWCPICNLQVAALVRALPEIRACNGTLLAIHPDTETLLDEPPDDFAVLADKDQAVIRAYDLQLELPTTVQDLYLNALDFDLSQRNADGSWNLPVPGTFVIDTDGVVRKRHVSADYTRRMEPDEVVEALEEIVAVS